MKPSPKARRNTIDGGHNKTFIPLSDWQQKVQTLSGQLIRRLFIASGGGWNGCDRLKYRNVQLAYKYIKNRLMV